MNKNYVLSRVMNERKSISWLPHQGPSFGTDDLILYGGHDDSFNNCYSSCEQSAYEEKIRETKEKFSVKEYEVFQIST
ncbi:hypothetical protein C1646_811858 [Rhizophagus diaphanus]|nr:hypothetical protein C1646_811858 [Rhizophagus diaphanus] [Rhizophagus sp. MUCL 43196]